MNPVIGETWINVQYPVRRVRILRLMRGEYDPSNLRIIYEYIGTEELCQDTVENFADNFERVTND
jgi:hypothetical protein